MNYITVHVIIGSQGAYDGVRSLGSDAALIVLVPRHHHVTIHSPISSPTKCEKTNNMMSSYKS